MGYSLITCLCVGLALAVWCPDIPAGKACRGWLVEAPATLLDRLSFRAIVGWAVFCVALFAIAQALPIELAMLGALDASAFTEVMVAVGLLAANLRMRQTLKGARVAIRALASRVRFEFAGVRRLRRADNRRSSGPPRARLRRPLADDDGGPVFAFA